MNDDKTTRQRHVRVKEIFASACLRNTSERLGFLEEACEGDEDLRLEVESLLEFHEGEPEDGGSAPNQTSFAASGTRGSDQSSTRVTGRFNPGELFAKRYRIVSLLGIGGMGEVYHAHDEVLDGPVALKFIIEANEERRENLLNEVRLARRVTHPSVCRVYDVCQVGQEYFISMEYVDGENMASLLRRVGRFPSDKLLELAHQLCAGLHAAHAQGVLHQDLKPANILVDNEGRVRITDFGIATTESSSNNRILGTPAYMAPERLGGQKPSVQSDLYALGLVLYEMASGKPAFKASTPFEFAALHRSVVPEAPTRHTPDLDKKVEAVILKCLEKDPRSRPASVLEISVALPGGDPLKMAMEAGETPPPELLAKIRTDDEGLHPIRVATGLAGLAAFLVALFLIAGKAFHLPGEGELKPPAVLVDRAQEILHDLGHGVRRGTAGEGTDLFPSRAWGFVPDVGPDRESIVHFWYRQSPDPLIPSDGWRLVFDDSRVDFFDPPNTDPGMVQMILDARGRLMMFDIIPPILEEDQVPAADGGPDWDVVLRAGGYDPAEVRPAEGGSRRVPRIYVEERRAWTGADPRASSARDGEVPRVHIDAASHRGRVVYFSAWPEQPEDFSEGAVSLFESLTSLLVMNFGFVLVVVVAIFIAVINLRRGRGDLRGARNLVFFVVGVKVVNWLLMAPHVAIFEVELVGFHVSLGVALVEALLVWVAYIALEPTVRRCWPRSLISWNRVLRGRWRDPLIGQGFLIGALVGTGWALLRAFDHLMVGGLGLTPLPEYHTVLQLNAALSSRLPFANLLTSSLYAIYAGVLWLFVLGLFRLLGRRAKMAVAGFVVIQVLGEMLTAGHPEIAFMTLGIVVAGSSAWILVRFGLLPYIVALFVESVLTSSPITSDLSAWFSGAGIFALLVPVVLATYGAWNALAGRVLIGDWLAFEGS